jgi:hypothetical protein
MGDSKRRKLTDPNYGRPQWLWKSPPTEDDLRRWARIVPEALSIEIAYKIRTKELVPPENARMPADWPYYMRCLEVYPPANDWIEQEIYKLIQQKLVPEFRSRDQAYVRLLLILGAAQAFAEICEVDDRKFLGSLNNAPNFISALESRKS